MYGKGGGCLLQRAKRCTYMGVVVYFAGLRSVLEGLAILPFLYTSVEKIKKKALQEGGSCI